MLYSRTNFAVLAQLVERSTRNAKVPSSILGDGSSGVAISRTIWYASATEINQANIAQSVERIHGNKQVYPLSYEKVDNKG